MTHGVRLAPSDLTLDDLEGSKIKVILFDVKYVKTCNSYDVGHNGDYRVPMGFTLDDLERLRRSQWRIQDFCEGDAAGVWFPIFSEGMTPIFSGRLLARIGVARIFRGWVRPGVDPGFLVGGRWRGRRPRMRRGRRKAPERRGGGVWGGAP